MIVRKSISVAAWLVASLQVQIAVADEILVAVASNFSTPMTELVQQFEQQTGHEINVVYGSSGRLYAQIINGAPFQIFLSADQDKPAQLENKQLIVSGSRFTYASGVLVLWSADENRELTGPEALEQPFNRIAIANPELAPYGQAAVEVLSNSGQYESLQPKLVQGENIAQTFQFVQTGNAELGFVALSQVGSASGIERGVGWVVPPEFHSRILQDAVQLGSEDSCKACADFLGFLKSNSAIETIRAHGYR